MHGRLRTIDNGKARIVCGILFWLLFAAWVVSAFWGVRFVGVNWWWELSCGNVRIRWATDNYKCDHWVHHSGWWTWSTDRYGELPVVERLGLNWPYYRRYSGFQISSSIDTDTYTPMWIAVLAVLIPFSLLTIQYRRRRKCIGGCGRCGYDLTGNSSGVCPECGTIIPRIESSGMLTNFEQ